MSKVADEILQKYGVSTKAIQIDLDGPYTVERCQEIEQKFADLENVSILINNAGVGNYGNAHELGWASALSCI